MTWASHQSRFGIWYHTTLYVVCGWVAQEGQDDEILRMELWASLQKDCGLDDIALLRRAMQEVQAVSEPVHLSRRALAVASVSY